MRIVANNSMVGVFSSGLLRTLFLKRCLVDRSCPVPGEFLPYLLVQLLAGDVLASINRNQSVSSWRIILKLLANRSISLLRLIPVRADF
jgi:hypothetical protein